VRLPSLSVLNITSPPTSRAGARAATPTLRSPPGARLSQPSSRAAHGPGGYRGRYALAAGHRLARGRPGHGAACSHPQRRNAAD
jgi:hypothetical protein